MKKNVLFIFIIAIVVIAISVVFLKGNIFMSSNLITVDELIAECDIDVEKYPIDVLKDVIEDYEITKENLKYTNVLLILEEYSDTKSINYMFDKNHKKRSGDFSTDIVSIAFFEYKSPNTKCFYLSVKDFKKYVSLERNFFDNVDSVESITINAREIESLINEFNEIGVFSWEELSYSKNEIIDVSQIRIVVEYEDGTYFDVLRSGVFNSIIPENYDEFINLLFK